ncbi:pyridoxal 5'-phosphate synthase, synthase subunit Pdx1 [Candidozyma auris]|nr:pyridoxal 5'-phosphate synthase, synthase subunit Pdx1 [[Candida] auris]
MRIVTSQIKHVLSLAGNHDALQKLADEYRVPKKLLDNLIDANGKLPVVNFAAGGVATPSDAALCMQLGCDGVFVGSGIFKSKNPEKLAKAIVDAVTHYNDPAKLLEVSTDLGELMFGKSIEQIPNKDRLAGR